MLSSKVRYLVPSRTGKELLIHACKGFWSLVNESHSRELLRWYKQNGIIRYDLMSSNFDFLTRSILVASLWDELEQSKEYGFQPQEFLEGVTPALGQFHAMQRKFDHRILHKIHGSAEWSKEFEMDTTTCHDETSKEDLEEKMKSITLCENDLQELKGKFDSFPQSDSKSKLDSIYPWNWNDEIVHDFYGTVSPEFYKSYQLKQIFNTVLWGKEHPIIVTKTEVNNVMILSARACLLEETSNNIKFDELNMEIQENENLTVAMRVDVFYDTYRTFIKPPIPNLIDEMNDRDDDDYENDYNSNKVNLHKKKYSEHVHGHRWHAVFEGYLKGGGKNDSLRWRISDVKILANL
jgi:hypothetical protein